jgi:hypothetical protein
MISILFQVVQKKIAIAAPAGEEMMSVYTARIGRRVQSKV